jgi:hypothetical protein
MKKLLLICSVTVLTVLGLNAQQWQQLGGEPEGAGVTEQISSSFFIVYKFR